MRWQYGLVLVVVGCGNVSSKQPDAAVTPNPDSALPPIDAPPPPCDVTKPFGTPQNVGGVNTNSGDVAGWLSEDQLTIYFASAATNATTRDIYTGTRAQPTGAFSGVMLLGGSFNTTAAEDRPVTTGDGLTMFVETSATGGGDIHIATRTSTGADFSAHSPVAAINDANAVDWNPWISADGLTLYFGSNRGGNYDIYRTSRPSTSANFAAPTAVGELNAPQDDYSPVLSADGREIFFASYRAGNNNNDIWHATRSTPTDGFGTPVLVTELNGATTDEYPSWISPDRCTLMFTSTRSGGNGGQDIWIATRPK